ncbi:MAG: SUMF1/EgtB/PvdO family nonheme iron enzyme [Planctomycetaceae bacterium]|nr:SUMF1/EgtB/PvdO family nonheme iron enzyme [Planctomycetaceae bacterium]
MTTLRNLRSLSLLASVAVFWSCPSFADEPKQGDTQQLSLGSDVSLELVYVPPGEFMMGSTAEEKQWATGIEGGAQPGTVRESYEGEPRSMRVGQGFWMGRTEVTRGQFAQFVEDTVYVTDAERPGGATQVFDHQWDRYYVGETIVHPWKSVTDKSWRDPGFGIPMQDDFPVVCVSYQDMKAFCRWLTEREREAGRLADGWEIRLPTEAEWAYACRGGSQESHHFWWGDDLMEGQGRLNISAVDFLPGRDTVWPLANAPWSDGYSFLSPVDHYGEQGRNGFGLADMCGGVWEFVLDDFDPTGGHEELHYLDKEQRSVSRPVCRGGNYFDVPGNARCAVRLGILDVAYSDSRDGFRICLGVPQETVPVPRTQ